MPAPIASDGSGTFAPSATPGADVVRPKLFASTLKSTPLTTPSKLKSPSVHVTAVWPKCEAIALKSSVLTNPSRLASPAIDGNTAPTESETLSQYVVVSKAPLG